ncbi:IS5 family transposase [Streptomyces sp. NPDC054933]
MIEPLLTAWRAPRLARKVSSNQPLTDPREVVNAIKHLNKTGCAWEDPPHNFPPHQTVYFYFRAWRDDGTLDLIHDTPRRKVRKAAGREEEPTAAVLDSQSVKTAAGAPGETTGYDAAKRIKGRKRFLLVDTLGLVLVVLVLAASAHDNTGGTRVLDRAANAAPRRAKVWTDSGFKNTLINHAHTAGIDVEVVQRDPDTKGFAVLPRRWVVERTNAWSMQHRRLTRHYEALPATSEAMIKWSMVDVITRRLTSGNTPTWRDPKPINA